MLSHRLGNTLQPVLLLGGKGMLCEADDATLAGGCGAPIGRGSRVVRSVLGPAARPLPVVLFCLRRDLLLGRVLRDARLDAVDGEPVHRKARVDGDARQRLGEQVGEVELRVLEVEDALCERAAKLWRVGRGEAVQGLAVS